MPTKRAEPERRSSRGLRGAVLLVVGSLLVLVALAVWMRSRPAFGEEEVAEANRALAAHRRAVEAVPCDDGAATTMLGHLVALDESFGACGPAVARLREVERSVPGDLEDELEPARERVRSACARVADGLSSLRASPRACSPFRMGRPEWLDPMAQPWDLAVAELATAAAVEGDVQGALTLLLDGVAAAQRLRAGPVNVMAATISTNIEELLWHAFMTLLDRHALPSDADVESTNARLDLLRAEAPHPHDTFAGEVLAVFELSAIDAGDDLALLAGARLSEVVARACPPTTTAARCFTDDGPDPPGDGFVTEALVALGGERAEGRHDLERFLWLQHSEYQRVTGLILRVGVMAKIAQLVLALARARRDGRCPPDVTLDPALLTLDIPSYDIAIEPHDGRFDLVVPPLPQNPSVSSTFSWHCPAVEGG